MRNDDHFGGFENLAKGRNKFAFCCAIQKLSPVGGPPCGSPGLPTSRPAHPRLRRVLGRTTFTLPLGRAFARPSRRGQNRSCLGSSKPRPLVSSPVYAGLYD
jgi:hypothetical protein